MVSPIASEPQPVGADRTWSATVIIPDQSQVGDVPAYATCETSPESVTAYTPITLNVTTPRHLEVQPGGAVRPGTTLSVTAIGTCPGSPGNSVVVGLLDAKQRGVDDVSVPLVVGGDGNWSGRFVLPGELAPGSYVLGRGVFGLPDLCRGLHPVRIRREELTLSVRQERLHLRPHVVTPTGVSTFDGRNAAAHPTFGTLLAKSGVVSGVVRTGR